MVEDRLREGLATSGRAEIGRETEGLVDWKISSDGEHGGTGSLLLGVDVTTATSKDTVNATHGLLWDLDLDLVDGLENARISKESRSVEDTTSSRDELTTTTMNGISVESDILDVEANRSHWLLSDRALTGSPLEARNDRVLDFIEVLDGLGLVNEQVGTIGVRTEAPNLTGIGDIPAVLISKDTGTSLEIITRADRAGFNGRADLLGQGLGSDIETVVLVGRLGQGGNARLATDGLTVGDNGVRDTERDTGMVILKILQADLQVQFSGTSNNVLTGLGDEGQDTRIGLGKTLETLDKLGKIVCVLHLN